MKIVITQPTYLSWIGYYGLIDLADVFVFYDDVQFERRSWQSRNKIANLNVANGYQWLTVPIIHNGQNEKINEVKISYDENWQEKHWKSIYYSYCRAPYFERYKNNIKKIYEKKLITVSELNIYIVKTIAELLGIRNDKFILSSSLKGVEGNKTDRLVSVIKNLKLNQNEKVEYLSTVGTKVYLEIDKFSRINTDVLWYDYEHPIYNQPSDEFIPYLSIIDLLFNEGDNSLKIIRENLRKSLKSAKYSNVLEC